MEEENINLRYLDFLPKSLSDWGNEIYKISKADPAMICYSLLGALSSAGCHLVNEKRYISKDGTFLEGPVGISLIVIAGSGSLKSTIKNMTFKPIEDIINIKMPSYLKKLSRYRKQPKTKKTFSLSDTFEEEDDVEEPVTPSFIQNNVTIEAVINLYKKGLNSITLLSDEGGTFVGSRAMSKESYINTLSAFNTLLSGDVFCKSTVKDGETFLSARRLTFMMLMQPQIFEEFMTRCGNISDAGFMQRTLIVKAYAAKSEIGDEFLSDTIDSFWEKQTPKNIYESETYNSYKELIQSLVERQGTINIYNLLDPPAIEPSMESKAIWLKFYVEQKRIIKKNLEEECTMNSFRERAPETASRVATLFQLADNRGESNTEITKENMQNAISLVKLSLEEQFKIYDIKDPFFENIDMLISWYNRREERGLLTRMPLRALLRIGPTALRRKDILLPILEYLTKEAIIEFNEIDYIYLKHKGKRFIEDGL